VQTLRDVFGNIFTWQSADGTIDDIGALTASIGDEVSQPRSGIAKNANVSLLMPAAHRPDVDAAGDAARRTIRDGRRVRSVVAILRAMFDTGAWTDCSTRSKRRNAMASASASVSAAPSATRSSKASVGSLRTAQRPSCDDVLVLHTS